MHKTWRCDMRKAYREVAAVLDHFSREF